MALHVAYHIGRILANYQRCYIARISAQNRQQDRVCSQFRSRPLPCAIVCVCFGLCGDLRLERGLLLLGFCIGISLLAMFDPIRSIGSGALALLINLLLDRGSGG